MRIETRNRLKAVAFSIASLCAGAGGAKLAFQAMIMGSYERYGHPVTDPFAVQFYVTMMAFGSLGAVGLGIAFAYAAWAEKGVGVQIDAYLARRRSDVGNPAGSVAELDPQARIEPPGVSQSPNSATKP